MKLSLIATAVLMALVLAGCPTPTPTPIVTPPPPTDTATPTPCGQDVSVELGGRVVTGQRTYFVEPDPSCTPSGSVTFNVHNGGAVPHEFIVYRTDLAADALPVDLAAAVLESSGIAGSIDQAELGSRQSASVTVDLDAGSYVLLCNIPTHYEQGMRTAFTVGGGES